MTFTRIHVLWNALFRVFEGLLLWSMLNSRFRAFWNDLFVFNPWKFMSETLIELKCINWHISRVPKLTYDVYRVNWQNLSFFCWCPAFHHQVVYWASEPAGFCGYSNTVWCDIRTYCCRWIRASKVSAMQNIPYQWWNLTSQFESWGYRKASDLQRWA